MLPQESLPMLADEACRTADGGERPVSPGRLSAAVVVVVIAALPALHAAHTSRSYGVESFKVNASDALIFRSAAELLAQGRSPYDVQVQRRHIAETRLDGQDPPYSLPFAYPPNALPLFMLCLVGPPRLGFVLFVAVGTLLMLAAAYRLAGRFSRHSWERTIIVVGTGFGGAAIFNAMLGQTGAYLGAAVFAYAACYRRAPGWAGVALGLMAFKPQYALLLGVVALVDRQWRTVAAAAATFVACSVLSGLLFGFDQWAAFLDAVRSFNYTADYMCNWIGITHRLYPGELRSLYAAGTFVMLIGVVGVAAYCALDTRGASRSMRHLAVAIALATLVSPNTHPYDLIIWLVPVCVAAGARPRVPLWAAVFVAGFAVTVMLAMGVRWMLPLISCALLVSAARSVWEDDSPSRIDTVKQRAG